MSVFSSLPGQRAGAVLTIDGAAIRTNWQTIQAALRPGCQAAAVVKADAYGLGMARVAPLLAQAGCRRFVVATLDEGADLRALLPDAEIIVLCGPQPGCAADLARLRLIPALNSPAQVALWEEQTRRSGQPSASVLHIDTGMARLGLTQEQAVALAAAPHRLAALAPQLVMSHLACADEPDHPLNALQLQRFAAARALFPDLPGSLAASSGLFLAPDYQQDWVRPGAALYGLAPFPGQPSPLRPVVGLRGQVLQIRSVTAGESVGYGASWIAPRDGRLAVVGAGYADGLLRSLSSRGSLRHNGGVLPIAGRVSMDLLTVDISDLPENALQPGDFLDLTGPGHDIDDLAREAGTIGYELLTALGRRYHRVWSQDGVQAGVQG